MDSRPGLRIDIEFIYIGSMLWDPEAALFRTHVLWAYQKYFDCSSYEPRSIFLGSQNDVGPEDSLFGILLFRPVQYGIGLWTFRARVFKVFPYAYSKYLHTYIHMYTHMHIHIHIRIHIHIHAHTRIHIHLHMHVTCAYVHLYVCVFVCQYTYILFL